MERNLIERGPTQKPRIIIPEGWGQGKLDNFVRFMSWFNPEILEQAEGRAKVDQDARKMMSDMGFSVIEKKGSEKFRENDDDFVIVGRTKEVGNELDEIKKAVPDINIIESFFLKQYRENPFFPVVAVFEGKAGGIGKYLLREKNSGNYLIAF